MTELIQTPGEADARGRSGATGKTRTRRRDWTTRGALLFWIVASGVVWIALAASAMWIY